MQQRQTNNTSVWCHLLLFLSRQQRSTFNLRGTQLGIESGRKSFFTLEETGALAHMLLELHATGMVLDSKQARKVATSYLKLAGRGDLVNVNDGLLGRDWFYKFIVDHPFLSD